MLCAASGGHRGILQAPPRLGRSCDHLDRSELLGFSERSSGPGTYFTLAPCLQNNIDLKYRVFKTKQTGYVTAPPDDPREVAEEVDEFFAGVAIRQFGPKAPELTD